MIPTLLHLPHASTVIPSEWQSEFLLDEEALRREMIVMTDHATDALFWLPGADRLVFPVSRLLVDPERYAHDVDEPMAARGMGAVYTRTHDGRPLKKDARRGELMARYYAPHHRALEDWCEGALARGGRALVLDCHSFPSQPLPCDLDQTPDRPAICLGTTPHTPREVLDAALERCAERGWSVSVDRPYAGAMVPTRYTNDPRVVPLMIEVRRDLYANEETGVPNGSFDAVRAGVTELMRAVVGALS